MKILALEGGGCLGYSQSIILSKIEQLANQPINQIFDMIGGTSVGAIMGAHLAIGIPAVAIESFFTQAAAQIFKSNIFTNISILCGARYSASTLEAILQKNLGDATLADCKIKFIATAVDMASGKNVYFQSYGKSSEDDTEIIIGPDSRMKLWQVARASSAAESYFPAYQWNGKVFWDGGSTGCNDPSLLLYTEGKQLTSPKNLNILSVAVAKSKWPFIGEKMINPNAISMLKATIAIAYGCVENSASWMTKENLGNRYNKIIPRLNLDTTLGLDDASPKALAFLKDAANQAINENLNILKNIIK